MLRCRCPNCSQLLQAHELRAGKKSVCSVWLASHVIPADRAKWLNESGEPLYPQESPVPESVLEPVGGSIATQPVAPVVESIP